MSAEELRRSREDEYQQRRIRQSWIPALGGRSGLAAPMTRTRTIGGVQSPSVGTAREWTEIATFHHPGTLTIAAADPYPVTFEGAPFVTIVARVPPSTDAEFTAYRNGIAIGSPMVLTTGFLQVDFDEVFIPTDLAHIAVTDLGTGGTAGVVSTFQFRPSVT